MDGLTIKIVYKEGTKSLPPDSFSQFPSILPEAENTASDLGIFLDIFYAYSRISTYI